MAGTLEDRRQQIRAGAERGDFHTVRRILDATPLCGRQLLFDTGWADKKRPLLATVLGEHHLNRLRIVRYLLDRGADVNRQNRYCATALWSASYLGDEHLASLLICRGASLDLGVPPTWNNSAVDE